MKFEKKAISLFTLLMLAGCAFRPVAWTDNSDIPQRKGVAFVEILLDGRDSADVFIDVGAARAYSKLSIKKGRHVYAMVLDEGVYFFRTLLYDHETFMPVLTEKVRPLNSESSKGRGSEIYCSSWNVKRTQATIIGQIQFNVVENDNFYLKCDERDSTRLAIENYARKLYPKTFQFYQGE